MNNKLRQEMGLPYHYDDPALYDGQREYQELLFDYNQLRPTQVKEKQALMKQMFAQIGEGCTLEVPVHSNWGCHHVHMGENVYCNSNVTFVDDGPIYIGNHCLIAPNVVIATAGHPILPILREHNYVYCQDVHIGNNVWIGSNASILPGVTIGDNSVIGAGSVVTSNIPNDVIACGVPCKVIRQIGEKDEKYYFKDKELDVKE